MIGTPTRFPFGVTNVIKASLLGNYPNPNPLTVHEYANDFDDYTAAQWTLTTAGAGATAVLAGNGGLVRQTTNGAGTDPQFNLKNPAAFQFNSGMQTWFMWNGEYAALTSVLQVGLQAGGTAFAPTDGVFFTKATGSADVNLVIRAASTSTTIAAVTTMAIATRTTLGFYFDGRATPTLYVFSSTPVPALVALGQPTWSGGVMVTAAGSLSPVNTSLANLPLATNLAIGFGLTEGAAAATTMTTDYILAANEILRF